MAFSLIGVLQMTALRQSVLHMMFRELAAGWTTWTYVVECIKVRPPVPEYLPDSCLPWAACCTAQHTYVGRMFTPDHPV